MRKRSELMDEKVIQKQRKNEEEETLYIEKRKREDKNRRQLEEEALLIKKKRKNSPKKINKKQNYEENVSLKIPEGVKEIYKKYHCLVGENKLKYPIPMDGNCQGVQKPPYCFRILPKGPLYLQMKIDILFLIGISSKKV